MRQGRGEFNDRHDSRYDIDKIKEFVDPDLKDFLHDIIFERRSFLVPGRHHSSLLSSVDAIEHSLKKTKHEIGVARSPRTRRGIVVSGLYGPQLQFKLDVFYSARGEYLDFVHGAKETDKKEDAWLSRLRALAKHVLEAASVLAGSIAKIFPQFEAVAELIDALIAAINICEPEKA